MSTEGELVVVFAGHTVEADFVKMLLESEGIEAFLIDENMGRLATFSFFGGSIVTVKVVVRRDDVEIAEPIVREFAEDGKE